MVGAGIFWLFQITNGLTALLMFLFPKKFHESLFPDPKKAYEILGFSSTAVEMIHNVIRGQSAALLAISIFIGIQGRTQPTVFLLIALCCGLTLISHFYTAIHHLKSSVVMTAIDSIKPLYGMICINILVCGGALYTFIFE